MLQQDYLMRMFTVLAIAMRESMLRAQGDEDPEGAAALDKTTEIDGALLLQMAPESFVAMVQLSQTDPALIGYISRTLMLESHYLSEAGFHERATLRAEQAQALARAYGFELGPTDITPEELDRFFEEQNVDPSDASDPSSLS